MPQLNRVAPRRAGPATVMRYMKDQNPVTCSLFNSPHGTHKIDAREFFDAYAKRTWRRYPNAKATEITSDGDTKAVNGAASSVKERHEWQTDEGRVVVELQGPRVLIMEGIPDNADIKALSKASWQ